MPFKNPHPLYQVWNSMKQRCTNPNNRSYHNYGGRGIKVCDRWQCFHHFVSDMGERPKGLSLDRIDNDKGYSPDNCRWASRKEQQRNRRNPALVIIEGKSYRAIELAEKIGCKTDTIVSRANKGLSMKKVLSEEPMRDLSGLSLGGEVSAAKRLAKTHCKWGHEFDAKNTGIAKTGARYCRKCRSIREGERRKRLKQMP